MFEIPSRYKHKFYKNVSWNDSYNHRWESLEECGASDAEIVSSEIENGLHAPVLDIDIPATLIPSSTPGHYHLYLDIPMSWRKYKRMMKALARAGVLEEGFVKASIDRGHSSLRVPGLKKGATPKGTPTLHYRNVN